MGDFKSQVSGFFKAVAEKAKGMTAKLKPVMANFAQKTKTLFGSAAEKVKEGAGKAKEKMNKK